MKTFAAPLLALLQTTNVYGRADLFSIVLPNGQTMRSTSSQVDIVFGGNTYYATRYGAWQRGRVTSEASFSPKANDMSLTALVSPSVFFPGTTVPLMQCVAAGLFDQASVTVYTAYWAAGEAPNSSRGVETKFVGQIMNFNQSGRSSIEFVVGDLLYLLGIKTPPKFIQAGCRFTFGDVNCGFNLATVTVSRTVASGSTTQVINLNSAVAASLYAGGFIAFTSGQNSGLKMSIKSQPSTTRIVLSSFTPLAITLGDAFNMTQGCNKSQARCSQLFGISVFPLHYGGTPYVPNPEQAI